MVERTVLHVLPHPGGGGETYVDALSEMDGYRFRRAYLAPSSRSDGALGTILRNVLRTTRRAHRHDLLHVHGEVAAALCLHTLATRPSVVTLHGLHLLRRAGGAARFAATINLRLILAAASRVICVSHSEHEHLAAAVGARAASRALVIPNGVRARHVPTKEERAEARAEFGLADGQIAGVWIAALDEHKDPLTPIRALHVARAAGADVALLVAGEGALRPEVERAALEGDANAVQVLGHRRDVHRLLSAADFFVLSSKREGLSLALLEAMSLGLPAVVSSEPANVEGVADTGIVVPASDTHAFASAFARLASSADRAALGNRARARVGLHFRAEDMVEATHAVYDEVVSA